MAWNLGTFTRFFGATGWQDDKASAINIVSSRHDTHDEDIAEGINACLTRDNQAKPTADFRPVSNSTLSLGSAALQWLNFFLSGIITFANGITLPDPRNVKLYGAKGDNATDDRAALNTANAAGITLYFPAGTYRINSNLTLSVPLVFDYGAILKPANGVTVTINADVDAGKWKIFDYSLGGAIAGLKRSIAQWFGAVGDGATSDTAALNNAATATSGGTVYLPNPATAYAVATGVTLPDNTSLVGENKRSCKILATANIDVLTLGDGSQLYSLYIEGNATTGHAIVVASNKGNQTIQNVRALNFDVGTGGGVLHYADNTAGSRISVHDFETSQTNGASGSDKYAIYVPDVFNNSAVPRKYSQIETGGKCAFFFGGCNDVFVTDSFLADCKFSSNSRSVNMAANRIANQTLLTVDGANHSIIGNDINPQILLPSTLTNSVIGPCSLNRGLAVNNTITGITAANPAVITISTGGSSNPFLVGQVVHIDSVVGMTQINDLEGTVTAIGGSTGAWTITVNIDSSAFSAYTSGGNLSLPTIIDNTGGNNYVQIFQGRQIYNPTVSNSGGTFVLGNGSCLGYYAQAGSLVTVWINFTVGSTTTMGVTELRFRLPKPKPDGEVITGGSGDMQLGAQHYTVVPQIPGNVAYARLFWSRNDGVNSGVVNGGGANPAAFAAGDVIRIQFSYER